MTDPLKERIVRHSPSNGNGSPDVWGVYEPNTASIGHICTDPRAKFPLLLRCAT
jgi:hypothetical protein